MRLVRALAVVGVLAACDHAVAPPDTPVQTSIFSPLLHPCLETGGCIQGSIAEGFSQNWLGSVMVIHDKTPSPIVLCDTALNGFGALVVSPQWYSAPATNVTVNIDATVAISRADRFEVVHLQEKNCPLGTAAVLLRPVPRAEELFTVDGSIPNDGQDHVGTTIVVTDGAPTVLETCGESYFVFEEARELRPGPASTVDLAVVADFFVAPGDRLEVMQQEACGDRLILTLRPIDPGNP